jgi:DNA-binding transcriptional LysR family regulator
MSIDLRQLRIFRAVHRLGSVGQAARQLNLTQPAVSKTVSRIEDELGVTLFERSPRGMVPTPYADALAVHAELISSEMDEAVETIRALQGLSKGRVKVGATPSVIVGALPVAIEAIRQRYPGLAMEVREGTEDDLLPPLLRGEVDLVICGSMRRLLTLAVVVEPLFHDPVCIICRPDHPLRGKRGLAMGDLLDYPWVLPDQENVMWRRLSDFFTAAGLRPPEPAIETNSATFMKRVAERGDHLTYLSRILTREEEAAGLLAVLDPRLATWDREVVIVRREKGTVAPPTRALIDALHAAARKVGAAPLP